MKGLWWSRGILSTVTIHQPSMLLLVVILLMAPAAIECLPARYAAISGMNWDSSGMLCAGSISQPLVHLVSNLISDYSYFQ